MESLSQVLALVQESPGLGWAAALLAVLLLGLLIGRRSGPPPRRRVPTRHPDQDRGPVRGLQKDLARLQSENTALSHFFQLLPGFTREITSTMEHRAVAQLLVSMADRLFAPSQILLFEFDPKVQKLYLTQQKGLSQDVALRFEVGLGEGKIGWVAEHGVEMEVNDFILEMRHSGEGLDVPTHSRFRTDLCAPLIHQKRLLGVISIGGMTRRYKNEKTILRLMADLGSIATYNSELFTQVQEAANSDGLTRLFNKRFFMNRLGEEIVRAGREHYPVSVFIFDLDHFKNYNDTQGHQAGDEVLKLTGRLLRESVRTDDVAARYGGEEFIVLLPRTPKDGARQYAEKFRKTMAEHDYPNRECQPLKCVSLSGGVASFPDDGRTGADLIAAADKALYRAKKAGRNRVGSAKLDYLSDESEDQYYGEAGGVSAQGGAVRRRT
ncbi:MAG: sensor domain-containing diguanylate cyclase [Acidobacteria bacterium]|nr:sensor domain-containing diguanylate cyclase [Acidobacteriota bacterium]